MSLDREKLTSLKESFWKEPVVEAKDKAAEYLKNMRLAYDAFKRETKDDKTSFEQFKKHMEEKEGCHIKEATTTKKELAAAAERTKSAMSFLRKIHKATEAGSLETVMDAIEKAATKGDIDDKQETRLKDALKRKKENLASNPEPTEPTVTEEEEVKADATEAPAVEEKKE